MAKVRVVVNKEAVCVFVVGVVVLVVVAGCSVRVGAAQAVVVESEVVPSALATGCNREKK